MFPPAYIVHGDWMKLELSQVYAKTRPRYKCYINQYNYGYVTCSTPGADRAHISTKVTIILSIKVSSRYSYN